LLTKQTSSAACENCPQDKFCKVPGAFLEDQMGFGKIYDGYVNTVGSRYPVPIPALANARSYCDRGNYCLKGVQIACPPGKYCEDYNLTTHTGDCEQGYYCEGGSMTKTPTKAADKGYRCTIGNYCLAGSSVGKKCPAGTFTNGTGLFSISDCNICPDGFMCT